ncbi:MAG TPA: sulfotransferase [Bacteroidales bacterium]|nr:sulfotransferase [Bacteroidales bacterium]
MFEKPFIFITGAPRSGTSLITKIIDAHPSTIILMENIFENRHRHFKRAEYWNDDVRLKEKIRTTYEGFSAPVLGNKVNSPDVWSVEDIYRFCGFFTEYKIVFICRNPMDVINSRLRREPEDFYLEFNEIARKKLLLNFSSRINVYLSSWRQSIENYWKLKDAVPDRIFLIYYEDFCSNFTDQVSQLFLFLGLPLVDDVFHWHEKPHHNGQGKLEKNLKYPDVPVEIKQISQIPPDIYEAIEKTGKHFNLYKNRQL